MLVRLLYASRSPEPISVECMEAILARSHVKNAEFGITGILCAYQNGNVFIQAVEGGRGEINALYNNIVQDPRHTDVTILDYSEIGERAFSNWRMGRVDLNRVNLSTIIRYSEHPQLDPFSLTGSTALSLLLELSTTTSVIGRGHGAK